ncbi:MAG: signal peptidase I [Proteobacteria bacterium]|nr:signal peptidase I [Pseudomonadota bacterium]
MSRKEELDDLINETEPLSLKEWLADIFKTIVPGILFIFFIRSSIAEPFRIPSGSMVPTLEIGDHILVTKYTYGFKIPFTRIPFGKMSVPDRGDVIVFVYPPSEKNPDDSYTLDLPFPPFSTLDYVKRVVGLPGDKIKVISNTVYINGKPQRKEDKEAYTFIDDRCNHYRTRLHSESLEGNHHLILTNDETFRRTALDYSKETVVPDDHVFVMGDNRDHSADSRVWGFVPIQNIKGKAQWVWLSYDQCTPGIPLLGDIRSRFGVRIQ